MAVFGFSSAARGGTRSGVKTPGPCHNLPNASTPPVGAAWRSCRGCWTYPKKDQPSARADGLRTPWSAVIGANWWTQTSLFFSIFSTVLEFATIFCKRLSVVGAPRGLGKPATRRFCCTRLYPSPSAVSSFWATPAVKRAIRCEMNNCGAAGTRHGAYETRSSKRGGQRGPRKQIASI